MQRLPNWSPRAWTLAGLVLVALVYVVAFARESIKAERACLRDQHAATFYVSPWTLTKYCTFEPGGGRRVTIEAEETGD